MNQALENTLNSLIGLAFKYGSHVYKLNTWRIKDDKFILETDRRTFVLYKNELNELLEILTIVDKSKPFKTVLPSVSNEAKEDILPPQTNKIRLDIYEPNENQKALQKSLLESLKLVQSDPKYIPQAKAVCDIANTMINMEKNQINMMNASKRSMRRK